MAGLPPPLDPPVPATGFKKGNTVKSQISDFDSILSLSVDIQSWCVFHDSCCSLCKDDIALAIYRLWYTWSYSWRRCIERSL